MRLERSVSANGRGHVYWVPAQDTEGGVAWVKVWDSGEVPIAAVAWELRGDEVRTAKLERRYTMRRPGTPGGVFGVNVKGQ